MKPHPNALYWQADEIAECLEVTDETYSELWNKIVPCYDTGHGGRNVLYVEDEEGFRLVEHAGARYPVTNYWDKLSSTAQAEVNSVLEKADSVFNHYT